jgi:CBS domain-containing protein
MYVKDIMDQNVVAVSELATVKDIMILIRKSNLTDFPVVDGDAGLKGVVYERDLLHLFYNGADGKKEAMMDSSGLEKLVHDSAEMSVSDIMTRNVQPAAEGDRLQQVGARMLFEKVPKLPVVTNGEVVGMVSQSRIFAQVIGFYTSREDAEKAGMPVAPAPAPQPAFTGGREKRFFRRVDMTLPIAYKPSSQEGHSDGEGRIGQTVNVSAGGLGILVKELLQGGLLLDIAVDLFQNGHPIICTCRVIRSSAGKEQGTYQTGLMFLAMSVSERKRILEYLDKVAPGEDEE